MVAQKVKDDELVVEALNEVTLVGRLAAPAQERQMPSGDTMRTFRVIVRRIPQPKDSRRTVDTIECVVWNGRVARSVLSWKEGDVVSVTGAIRRRFFRTAAGAASRVEVEVTAGRVVRRAANG